jgi:hypothetical protein
VTLLQEAASLLQVTVSHRRRLTWTYSGESESYSENALFKGKRAKERSVDKANHLKAELNPICYLLALLGGATIVVISRLRVKCASGDQILFCEDVLKLMRTGRQIFAIIDAPDSEVTSINSCQTSSIETGHC